MKKFTFKNLIFFTISIIILCKFTSIPSVNAINSPHISVSIIDQASENSIIIEDIKSTEIISGNSITIQDGIPSIFDAGYKSAIDQHPLVYPQSIPAPLTHSAPPPHSITSILSTSLEMTSYFGHFTISILSNISPAAGNNWLSFILMINIIMCFLGAYLRLNSGNSPGSSKFTS